MARPTKHQVRYRNVGRPTVINEEVIRKLEEVFAWGASVQEALMYADISNTTYYEFIQKNPQYKEKFKRLQEKPTLLARQSVINNMKEDGHLALKYLERKKKDEFSLRAEVTGVDGQEIKVNLTNFKSLGVDDLLKEASEDGSK